MLKVGCSDLFGKRLSVTLHSCIPRTVMNTHPKHATVEPAIRCITFGSYYPEMVTCGGTDQRHNSSQAALNLNKSRNRSLLSHVQRSAASAPNVELTRPKHNGELSKKFSLSTAQTARHLKGRVQRLVRLIVVKCQLFIKNKKHIPAATNIVAYIAENRPLSLSFAPHLITKRNIG